MQARGKFFQKYKEHEEEARTITDPAAFMQDLVKHIPIPAIAPLLEDLVSFIKAEARVTLNNDLINIAIDPILRKLAVDALTNNEALHKYAATFGNNIGKYDAIYDKGADATAIAEEFISHLKQGAHAESINLSVYLFSNIAGLLGNMTGNYIENFATPLKVMLFAGVSEIDSKDSSSPAAVEAKSNDKADTDAEASALVDASALDSDDENDKDTIEVSYIGPIGRARLGSMVEESVAASGSISLFEEADF